MSSKLTNDIWKDILNKKKQRRKLELSLYHVTTCQIIGLPASLHHVLICVLLTSGVCFRKRVLCNSPFDFHRNCPNSNVWNVHFIHDEQTLGSGQMERFHPYTWMLYVIYNTFTGTCIFEEIKSLQQCRQSLVSSHFHSLNILDYRSYCYFWQWRRPSCFLCCHQSKWQFNPTEREQSSKDHEEWTQISLCILQTINGNMLLSLSHHSCRHLDGFFIPASG